MFAVSLSVDAADQTASQVGPTQMRQDGPGEAGGASRRFNVFLSTTSLYRPARQRMAERLIRAGARTIWQDNPGSLARPRDLEAQIEDADLVVCLIGPAFGQVMDTADRPATAMDGCSWTQWEYLHSTALAKAGGRLRLLVFRLPPGPSEGTDDAEARHQRAFLGSVLQTEMDSFLRSFVVDVATPADAVAELEAMLANEDSFIGRIRMAYWRDVAGRYRQEHSRTWRLSFPDRPSSGQPPFIETQGFTILDQPDGRQRQHLTPAAFLSGRESELELRTRAAAVWRHLSRSAAEGDGAATRCNDRDRLASALRQAPDALVTLGGVGVPHPSRVFLVSGSGIGKSTNTNWLTQALNDGPDDVTAILIQAKALDIVETAADAITAIAETVCREAAADRDRWHFDSVRQGLEADIRAGRIVLLIDGLDHAEAGYLRFFGDIQHGEGRALFGRCRVVAAGRPHVLEGWDDHFEIGRPHRVVASEWRFIEPQEFTDEEAGSYLGCTADGISRYTLLTRSLRTLAKVPRILYYVRELDDHDLTRFRTAADVYDASASRLIEKTLQNNNELVWHGADSASAGDRASHILLMLAAIAFNDVCRTRYRDHIEEDCTGTLLVDAEELAQQMSQAAGRSLSVSAVKADLATLERFSYGLVSGLVGKGGVLWSNRTFPQFLAALWLSRWASAEETAVMRHHVYFPIADSERWTTVVPRSGPVVLRSHVTYELNLFLAEMPSRSIDHRRWIAATSVWFDPELFAGPAASHRLWPTEMMFRAWPRLTLCAGEFVDWWNAPYRVMEGFAPGDAGRRRPQTWHRRQHVTRAVALQARAVLAKFRGGLQQMLDGAEGPDARRRAQDMTGDAAWARISGGVLVMGRDQDKALQGCPTGKPAAYWRRELEEVQRGALTPHEAAEITTWPEWFVGAHGRRVRQDDVEWMAREIFAELLPHRGTSSTPADVLEGVLDKLRVRWQTTDETPAERHQAIRSFQMHRVPMLVGWYRLFEPGHRHCVDLYLEDVEKNRADLQDLEGEEKLGKVPPDRLPPVGRLTYPADGQPVTYVSWFDAWAFCEWARWAGPGPDDPERRGVWRVRLPHEPEWEYAAWGIAPAGEAAVQPPATRWWWGDDYYAHENDPVEEYRQDFPKAHGDGRPMMTRAPWEAEPNGFGLHDMVGNVWEWMANLYDLRPEAELQECGDFEIRYSREVPYEQPSPDALRAIRGGLWYYLNILATCTNRFRLPPTDFDFKRGFRLVREWWPDE